MLREFLQAHEEDAANIVLVIELAAALDGFRWSPAAEQLYRELVASHKRLAVNFATWLARRTRLDSALAVCQQFAEQGEFDTAVNLGVSFIGIADLSADQIALVEEWHIVALKAAPDSADVVLPLAMLRHFQGRSAESCELFRHLLKKRVNPFICLNNLAWVTCEGMGKPAEALAYVEQAITQFGPLPPLLDTRGVILTRLGRYDEAIADLVESANAQVQSPRTGNLKLARAYHLSGQQAAARAELEKINAASSITPALRQTQRVEYDWLVAQLAE
jgi:Tfp pilus assembly protein PilF